MNAAADRSKLYDVAKCLTMILVVVAHVTRMYTPTGAIPVANHSLFLDYLTEYIYAFHMPLFIMLSGCVYGHCIEGGKYTKIAPFVWNKVKKLLIPYLFFGLLTVAPVMCVLNLTQEGYIAYVFRGILKAYDSRHLWYVVALFWIFMLFALLRPLLLKGPLVLAAVGCGSLGLVVLARFFPVALQIRAACDYQLFFFCGVVFNRYYRTLDRVMGKYRVLGPVLAVLLLGRFVFDPNAMTKFGYKCAGIGMMLILCRELLRRFPQVMDTAIFRLFKRDSFGIYLFHPMIIYVLFHMLGGYDIPPMLLAGGITLAATGLSILGTNLLRKLHCGWAVGE